MGLGKALGFLLRSSPKVSLVAGEMKSALDASAGPARPTAALPSISQMVSIAGKSVLTQFWCSFDTCGTLAGIDDKSVISRNPLLRSEQGDASPDVQDRPGLGHGGCWSELCCLSWLPDLS